MPLALISPPLASQPGEAAPEEVFHRLPHEGPKCLLVKMGRTGPLGEPRRGPQAGKSGDPRSQNTNKEVHRTKDQAHSPSVSTNTRQQFP